MSRFKLPNYVYSNEHLLGILMELKDTSSAKWVGEKTELISLKPQQSLILTTDDTVIQSNQSQHSGGKSGPKTSQHRQTTYTRQNSFSVNNTNKQYKKKSLSMENDVLQSSMDGNDESMNESIKLVKNQKKYNSTKLQSFDEEIDELVSTIDDSEEKSSFMNKIILEQDEETSNITRVNQNKDDKDEKDESFSLNNCDNDFQSNREDIDRKDLSDESNEEYKIANNYRKKSKEFVNKSKEKSKNQRLNRPKSYIEQKTNINMNFQQNVKNNKTNTTKSDVKPVIYGVSNKIMKNKTTNNEEKKALSNDILVVKTQSGLIEPQVIVPIEDIIKSQMEEMRINEQKNQLDLKEKQKLKEKFLPYIPPNNIAQNSGISCIEQIELEEKAKVKNNNLNMNQQKQSTSFNNSSETGKFWDNAMKFY